MDNFSDPNKCYIYWEILLATKADVNTISDVFIFVEDDCHLEISKLSNFNLLEDNDFVAATKAIIESDKATIINDLQQILKTDNATANEETKKKKTENASDTQKKTPFPASVLRPINSMMLMNLVSELVTTQARLSLFAEQDGKAELLAIAENVQKLTRQLRDNAFDLSLIPLQSVVTRFQRIKGFIFRHWKRDCVQNRRNRNRT